ncbi:MAG: hypothetical protein ABSE53_16855 [Terracidiphilus sp.]|jgi:hypothetical protein
MSDCIICAYWTARISEEKARTIAGCEGAYGREQFARIALAAHLDGGTHTENRCETQSTFAGVVPPGLTRGERERWGSV